MTAAGPRIDTRPGAIAILLAIQERAMRGTPTNRGGTSVGVPGGQRGWAVRTADSDRILRFQKTEIRLHWAIAIPFLICYASSLALVFLYNPDPSRPYRAIFSWIHRVSGLCLFLLPAIVILRSRSYWKLHLSNICQAWLWTLSDLRWLARIGVASFNKKVTLPEQGKFNAGEKLNFMMVMTTYPLFILTGVLIWLPGIAFYSWMLHVTMAVVATPLMFGHIFMATINPDTRKGIHGMISGRVDREWARHHYAIWYRENFESADALDQGQSVHPAESTATSRESEPAALHDLCRRELERGRAGAARDWGRRALQAAQREGDARLIDEVFRTLWPILEESSCLREVVLAAVPALFRNGSLALAAEACTLLVRRDRHDLQAIKHLMELALIEVRERESPERALEIYDFLQRNADPGLSGHFRTARATAESLSRRSSEQHSR